ncbi:uncharacterized protein AB675_4224 [Cyphellophora attinorum]|jgi:Domain of unknown function (DUF4267)|uniref:Uncharacterized protein n=1 Tax=Cyphellophora attinorum TaxID=1664694 RepID=A0A0N1NXR2_9EURO|nr:uncharacterized protein AB675_4224 [Phialophora attinorum]KPI38565.1 hypothetical protein AB675_4224 [Phialophora attinorum]
MALPRWPYLFSYFIATWLVGVWAVCQTSYARTLCEQVGFPIPANEHPSPYFYLFANKEGVMGLVFLALQFFGEWKAVGIMMAVMCVNGTGDAYLSTSVGTMDWVEALKAHMGVTIVAGWAAWRILEENW